MSDVTFAVANGAVKKLVDQGDGTHAEQVATKSVATDPGRPRFFAAVGTALTRAANATPYSIDDSVSDNATIGSVTALPVTVSDVDDDPVTIERIRIDTADTGPGTAGATWEIYVYNSNPTASSGVQGGDNTAFSNKRAGLIGRMTGTWLPMQDGSFLEATPLVGSRLTTAPGSGAKTLWLQYKTKTAFTPSANSTVYTPTVEGFQGRV